MLYTRSHDSFVHYRHYFVETIVDAAEKQATTMMELCNGFKATVRKH